MDNQQLLEERVTLFHNAIEFKKVRRIPNLCGAVSSKICDTGYILSEALVDYNILKDVMRKYHEKYNFDCYREVNSRNPIRISDALGASNYIINDDDNSINYPDVTYMKTEEYDDVIDDCDRYIFTKFLSNKYPNLKKGKLLDAINETALWVKYLSEVQSLLKDEYGVPAFSDNMIINPFEYLFNGLRGFKETSLDLRRRPEKVKEALLSIRKSFPHLEMLKKAPVGPTKNYVFDIFTVQLGYYILNNNQFEQFYWPYLKEIIEYVVQYDKHLYIFAEGTTERFYEYYQDIPKGHVAIHLELDDIFNAKKRIGENICLCGGFPTELLKNGTTKECVDYTKRLIDDLGAADGGYIFSVDKMLTFKSDVNEVNVKAMNDFLRNYTF